VYVDKGPPQIDQVEKRGVRAQPHPTTQRDSDSGGRFAYGWQKGGVLTGNKTSVDLKFKMVSLGGLFGVGVGDRGRMVDENEV
jgi:hypothetical protein